MTTDISGISEQEQRWRGFRALRDLLRNMSSQQPLILSIDDLQWADADSWQLLMELLRDPGAPRCLFLGTKRGLLETENSPDPVVNLDNWPGHRTMLQLGPLEIKAAQQLAKALLRIELSQERLHALAVESQGHPLFLTELCHFSHVHRNEGGALLLEQALISRLAGLDENTRRFLEVVSLAGAPILEQVAVRTAQLPGDKIDATLQLLSSQKLIQTHGTHPQATVEPYHDRIRSCTVNNLTDGQQVLLHGALARTLEQCLPPQPQLIATHWQGAKQPQRACAYWIMAADKAAQALAFDQAARLYRKALEIQLAQEPPPAQSAMQHLRIQHAQALAHGGNVLEAAKAFQEASELAAGKEALELQQRAAVQLLRGGHIDKGIAALKPILQNLGITMPTSSRQTMVKFLWERLRLRLAYPELTWNWTDERDADATLLAKADICWDTAMGLLNIEQIRGMLFHTLSLHYALRAGEPYRITRSLALEAITIIALNNDIDGAQRLAGRASDLAQQIGQPYLQIYSVLTQGIIAFFRGHWRQCCALLNIGRQQFDSLPQDVSWELASCDFVSRGAQFTCDRWTESTQMMSTSMQEAQARGNLYNATATQLGPSNIIWLIEDKPAQLRALVQQAVSGWSQQGIHLQHQLEMITYANIFLYEGSYRDALQTVHVRWKDLRKAGLFRVQFNRVSVTDLHARAALACLFVDQDTIGRRLLYRLAKSNANHLSQENAQWALGLAKLIQAQLAYLTRNGNAVLLFQEAIELLEELDMSFQAAAARVCLAYLQQGHVPPKLLQAPCLRAVKKPLHFLSIYAPMLQVLLKNPSSS